MYIRTYDTLLVHRSKERRAGVVVCYVPLRKKERQKRRATHTGSRGFSDYFEKRIDDEEGEQQQEWKQRGVTLGGGVDDTVDRMFWFMDEWERSDACTM